ncbi:uncharacterized protein STM3670 [Arthrobacter sp. Hiyo6]|nr:uncharacterized protein STM3670 [Arthrobacter sp. Hiyo6]
MLSRPSPITVVAAQMTQPADISERASFAGAIRGIPGVDGFEVPVANTVWNEDVEWISPQLALGGEHVLSLIGAFMDRRADGVGLASSNHDKRLEAINLVRTAHQYAEYIHQAGSGRIRDLIVYSAPTAEDPKIAGAWMRESMNRILSWDWHGINVVIEHCDSIRHDGSFEKGFLPIEEELDILDALSAPNTGIVVNWARSAIEGRSTQTPIEHVVLARERGWLRGITLSGVVPTTSDFGQPWADAHAPFSDAEGAAGEPSSLLNLSAAADFIRAAGNGVDFREVKVAVRRADADAAARIETNRHALSAITMASNHTDADRPS